MNHTEDPHSRALINLYFLRLRDGITLGPMKSETRNINWLMNVNLRGMLSVEDLLTPVRIGYGLIVHWRMVLTLN